MRSTQWDQAISALYVLVNQCQRKVLAIKDVRELFGTEAAERIMHPGMEEALKAQAKEYRAAAEFLRNHY